MANTEVHGASGAALNRFTKSYTVRSRNVGTGEFYGAGHYRSPAADSNLSQASLTQAYGTANKSEAGHAFIVAGAAGTVDTGVVKLTVTGTSITDSGVRTTSDSEIILADISTATTDAYYETSKKWLGAVTYTLAGASGSPVNFSFDFNYGFCKYDDLANTDFIINHVELTGYAGANETNFEFELLCHGASGWTYSAAAFVPGTTAIARLTTAHSTDDQLRNDENFAFKLTNLSNFVNGSGSEGFIFRYSVTINNAIEYMNVHIGGTYS